LGDFPGEKTQKKGNDKEVKKGLNLSTRGKGKCSKTPVWKKFGRGGEENSSGRGGPRKNYAACVGCPGATQGKGSARWEKLRLD